MALSSRSQRLHKAISLLLISLLLGQVLAGTQGVPATFAQTPAPAAEQVSEPAAEQAEPSAESGALPPAACAAPAAQIYLPILFATGGQVLANQPPAARPCRVATAAATALSIDLGGVIRDANGDAVSVSLPGQPGHGAAALAGKILTYTPAAGFAGVEQFSYAMSDGRGGTATGQVFVTVAGAANQPPAADAVLATVATTGTATIDLDDYASDPDGDALAYAIAAAPAHGSAALEGGVLVYAPTAGFSGTDTLRYSATDPAGASASAKITFLVQPVGPQANQAPFTQPYTATAATTATLAFNLDLLAMDPDGDPLAFELAGQPAQGAAGLISHTLSYTPSQLLAGAERITYVASDDHGHAVTGTITLLPVATRLHVTPGAALLTAQGQSVELTVKAYNGQGAEIGLDGLDLEWVSTQPLSVSVAPAAGGAGATVTGLVAAGSATVVVRSASDPSVVSALVAVTVAGVKPGVQLVPDSQIVFPATNPIPNRSGSPYPAGPNGQPIIGAFSEDEVAAVFEVVGDYRTDAPVTSFKYPLVVSGAAPAVGSVLLASQSAPLMGRVTRVAVERGGFALVQIELLTFTDVFSDFDWSFSIAGLLESGLARPEQFIAARAAAPGLAGLRPELAAPFAPSAPASPQALSGACDLSKIFSFVGVEGKVLSPNVNFTPVYDGILQSGRFPEGDSFVKHFKILLGFEASLDLSLSLKFQPGVQFSLECELGDGFELELPNTGFLALINLLLGPQLEIGPKFETGLKMQGLVSFAIGASLKFGVATEFGYEYRNPDGFKGTGNWIKKFDPTSDLTPFMDGFDGESDAMQGKFEFTAGIVEGAEGNFVLGAGIWDVLEFFSGDRARELREKLTLRFIEGKAGLQLKLEWGTPHQVLAEKGNYSPAFNLNFIAEGVVKASTFGKALEKLLIFSALIDIKVFEVSVPLAPLYKPVEKAAIEVTPAGKTKPGETLTFKAPIQNGIPGVSPTSGALYHDGRKLAELTASPPGLSGTWKVDEQACAAAEASETGSVTLDVLGWNTMPNQPLRGIPLPSIIPTPSYVGAVELKCSEFSFAFASTPDLQALPDGTLNACYVPGRRGEVRVPFQLVARHDGGLLSQMDIHVDRAGRPDASIIVGPSSAAATSNDTKDLKLLDSAMVFILPAGDAPLLDEDFAVHATVSTRPVGDKPARTKEIEFDFDLHWADCTEPALTMEAAVAPAAQEDGAVYACTNVGESQGSVILTLAGRDEVAKIDRIELVARVTPNDHIIARKTIPGVAGQRDLNGVQTVQISRFDVGFDSAATAAVPASYTFEATIYALDDDNLPTRTKTVEFAVDVYWGTCETLIERELRTRTPGCQIITEQREIKTILYKMWFHGADQVIKEKEFEPTAWVWLRATPTDDCSRRPANTRGDPHIVTPDGRQYDSMALGEFTYLRPLPGEQGMTLQVRQERLGDTGTRIFFPWASWNTAVAVAAGGQTFEFWIDKFIGDPFITWGQPRLNRPRVNGQVLNLAPGLYSFGDVDLNVRSNRAIQLTYQGRTVMINHVLSFLELSVSVPLDNTHHGMLGTPNGNPEDDFRYPDGMPARDGFDMADAWRITDPAHSLFTYKPGEGPHTFNLEQINQPPSSAELAPYVDQARDLLLATCRADSLNEVAVNNTAMELMVGREPRELAGAGLCWFAIEGTVYNSLVPGLPVPGARVVVTSPQLETCETYTDRQGNYRCDMPATGELPTVTATVSGRGQGSATLSLSELPPMDGYLPSRIDLAVAPTTLHLNGTVRDGQNRPLYNAQLSLTGPAGAGFGKAYAQTDGDGAYSAYLMLDDGAGNPPGDGQTRYDLAYSPSWSTDPDAAGVSQTITRSLPVVQPNALNPISESIVLTGSLVRFSGRVSFQQAPDMAAAGARVRVLPTAPVAGWTICDEPAGLDGSYACELPLSASNAFQVQIEVDGRIVAGPITVDPAGSGVGEVIPVVTNVQLPSGLLRVGGLVRDPSGAPLAGATVNLRTDATFGGAEVVSDAAGRYTATLGLFPGATAALATYRVSYGTLEITSRTAWEGLDPTAINQRAHDLTIGGSRLVFSGRIANAFAPAADLPFPSTLVISSPAGLLCEIGDVRGDYACQVDLDQHGDNDLRVEYAASGPWGSHRETVLLGSLPAAGESRTLVRDLVPPLTTVRLQGSVRTAGNPVGGAPLAGATVRVAVGEALVEGKTGVDGAYDLLLTLPAGPSVRNLEYTVQYRTAIIRQTRAVEAAPAQLTTVSHDVAYDQRPLYFRGKLSNPYGITMPASQVVIAAGPLSAPCVTQTSPDGSYLCVTQSQASAPFSATFSLSGFWGSQAFTQTVAAAADQAALDHAADFTVAPTAVRLHGVVAAPSGAPLAGVEVTAGGAAAVRAARATTDPSGAYALYVFLSPAEAAMFTRTLSVRVGYGGAVRAYTLPVAAARDSLTEIRRDWALDGRVIRFQGAVLSSVVQGMPINGSRVLVSSPDQGRLCEWNALERATTNRYSCDAIILGDQPFEVLYTLVGPWGSAAISGTVATLPDVGGLKEVDRTLHVAPTTLRLSGQVRGRSGAPLANARLVIAAPELVAPLRLSTEEDGTYAGVALLRADALSATLAYSVDVTGLPGQTRAVSLTARAGGLSDHEESFDFATARAIALSGAVRNTTLPALALNGRITIVSPSADEPLCSATLNEGAYRCTALVAGDGALTASYRVEGDWGQIVLQNQTIPAGAASFAQDFDAAPTVVRFVGAVSGGGPLAGAEVTVSSYDLVPGRLARVRATSDGAGAYAAAMVLGQGVSNGGLIYQASANGNSATAQRAFALSGPGRLHTIEQDLNLTTRTVRFTGQITNTVAPEMPLPISRLIISSAEHGRLCEAVISGGSRFSCSATLAGAAPFTAVYALSGEWGSSVATQPIANLPAAGGQITVDMSVPASPAMLRVRGRVRDGAGADLPRVAVSAAGSWVAATTTALSDAEGRYEVLVIVKDSALAQAGSFELVAAAQGLRAGAMVPFMAAPGALTEINAEALAIDFGLAPRGLVIEGNLLNANVPDAAGARPVGRISVLAPDGSPWCPTVQSSTYSCSLTLYSADPVDVVVRAEGDWGVAERRLTVSAIPEPGQLGRVRADVEVVATALRLRGRVVLPDGRPLSGVGVNIQARAAGQPLGLVGQRTDANGFYDGYLFVPAGSGELSLYVHLSYQGIPVDLSIHGVEVKPNVLNERQDTFTFTKRRVRFTG
ncbi:MAG TPA: Ig-like domain-containing protein, partial [Herpetosiphonaceae bacterium]|nr:Ig-like domain-containing protein [Herpetosiphonaceae bacterium]